MSLAQATHSNNRNWNGNHIGSKTHSTTDAAYYDCKQEQKDKDVP